MVYLAVIKKTQNTFMASKLEYFLKASFQLTFILWQSEKLRVQISQPCLPSNTVDFSSLTAFKRTIKCVDLVISSTLHRFLRTGIVSLTFILLMFLFYFFHGDC